MSSQPIPFTPLTIEAQNYLYMERTSNTSNVLSTSTTADSLLCAVELSKYPSSSTASYNSTTQTCTINSPSSFPSFERNTSSTLLMKVAGSVDKLVNDWVLAPSVTTNKVTNPDIYCSPELANVIYGRGLCANTPGCTGYRQYTDATTATDYGCLVSGSLNSPSALISATTDQAVFTGIRSRVVSYQVIFIDMNLAVLSDQDTISTLNISDDLQSNISSTYISTSNTSAINSFVLGTFTLPTNSVITTSLNLNYTLPFPVDGYTVLVITKDTIKTVNTVPSDGGRGSNVINAVLYGKNSNVKASLSNNTTFYVVLIVTQYAPLNTIPSINAAGSIQAQYFIAPSDTSSSAPQTVMSSLPSTGIRRLVLNSVTLTLSTDATTNIITLPVNYVCCISAYVNVATGGNSTLSLFQSNGVQNILNQNLAGNITYSSVPSDTLNSIISANTTLSATFARAGTCTILFFVNA